MTKKDTKVNLVNEIRKLVHDELDKYIAPDRMKEYERQKAGGVRVEPPQSQRDVMKLCIARAREIGSSGMGWKEPALVVYYNEKLLQVLEVMLDEMKLINIQLDHLNRDVKALKVKK